MAETNTVAIRLLGTPESYSYNLGTEKNPDFRPGGTVLEVSTEAAELYVKNRVAVYVDKSQQSEVEVVATEPILQSGDVTFDQTVNVKTQTDEVVNNSHNE